MSALFVDRRDQPWFRRLFLPAYKISEAARYSGCHSNTIANWHYRGDPVLPGRERRRPLNYLELVEVAFVAFFRSLGFSMKKIRAARDYVATNIVAEYPLAENQFKTEGMHILMEYHKFDPDPRFEQIIVADRGGQLAWADLLGNKFAHFDYEYELALRWHPAGRDSLVMIDPRISFGAPIVYGLPTWVVRGRWKAGESMDEISNDFGIPKEAVEDALTFEQVSTNNNGEYPSTV